MKIFSFFLLCVYLLHLSACSSNSKDISDVMTERYSLYDFKIKSMNKTSTMASPAVDISPKSKSNPIDYLTYLDQVHRYIALFNDTHLRVGENAYRPIIFNGISLVLINKKIYVQSINKEILKLSNVSKISIGDEVLFINNKKVIEWAKDLSKYIPSSSTYYALKLSTQTLSKRRYHYPKKNKFLWTFRAKRTNQIYNADLPFYVNELSAKKHLQAKSVLKNANVIDTNFSLHEKFPDEILEGQTSFTLKHSKKLLNSRQDTIAVFGKLNIKNQSYSYIKFDEFSSDKLYVDAEETNLVAAIDNFLKLSGKKDPIIFDIRYNGGGSGEVANKIFVRVLNKGPMTYYWSTKYRNTAFYKHLYSLSKDKFTTEEISAIESMIKNKSPYSRFSLKLLNGTSATKRNIMVLISSACISTCDIFSRLLKISKATIIGRPTNGTGSGFNSGGLFKFWTSPSKSFSIRIPVYLIGPSGKLPYTPVISSELQNNYLVENKPVQPSIYVNETWQEHFSGNMTNWLTAISKKINKK